MIFTRFARSRVEIRGVDRRRIGREKQRWLDDIAGTFEKRVTVPYAVKPLRYYPQIGVDRARLYPD